MKWEFEFEYAPSLNQMYTYLKKVNRRVLSAEAKAWKNKVKSNVVNTLGLYTFDKSTLFSLYIELHRDFLTKAGSPRKIDIDNTIKIIQDAIFEGIGLDDSHVVCLMALKVNDVNKFIRLRIETITDYRECFKEDL